jgi:signal transduction histidine kinase
MIFVPQKNTGQIETKIPDPGKLRLVGHGKRERYAADSENLDKITHDIRSSINIIIGYTQLMLDQTTGKINARQRQALQDILKSSNRLNDLAEIITKRLDTVSGKKQ